MHHRCRPRRPLRRRLAVAAVALAALVGVTACADGDPAARGATSADGAGDAPQGTDPGADGTASAKCRPTLGDDEELAAELVDVARTAMERNDLRAVLVSVRKGDRELVTAQLGESVDGVPATTDMRFFNGAVVFSYMGVAMLDMAAEGVLDIDEPIERWVEGVPGGDRITPRMLMASMSGLADFETMDAWTEELYRDPFRPFTTEELEAYVFDRPLLFEPGTNVSYSHLGFRLAGLVIEEAAGSPLAEVLAERVLEPLGLADTESVETVQVPGPVLRTYSDERGTYEETTSWSPAWGVPPGAMQVTSICDLARSAEGIGSGELLDDAQLATFLDPGTVDAGARTDDCPQCIPMSEELHFGMGVTVAGDWVIQTPSFTGIAAVQAHSPAEDLSIAVANTYAPGGDVATNASTGIFVDIAERLAPDQAVPDQIR